MGVAAIPMAMAAASSAQAGYSFIQQRQMASAAKKQQEANNKRVHQSMIDQYGQLSNAERQSMRGNLEDSIRVQREHAKRRASINLMAAASGTSGLSVSQLLGGVDSEAGHNMDVLLRNREIEMDNFRQQAMGIRTGAINQTDTRVIQRPSFLEGALNVGSAALQGYSQGSSIRTELEGGV